MYGKYAQKWEENIRATALNQFLNWLFRTKNKLQYAENKKVFLLNIFSSFPDMRK